MARWVGIDIRASHVRAVLLRTSYRKVAIEQMLEVSLAEVADLDAALRAVALPLMQQGEPFAIAVEGEQAFIHRLTLPSTALKQLAEVLPFEIEANVPVALDDLVHDHRLLRRDPKAEHVVVMTAAARKAQVRARIDHIKVILGAEPERVGVGTLPLANLASLCPQLAVAGPVAVVDLGGTRTEVVLLSHGEPVFARTLSRGVAGLPESASALAAELRQTFVAWLAHEGDPVESIFLVGAGAHAPGAESYLAHELGIAVQQLPPLAFEQITDDQSQSVPRFAKAIALALGLAGRGHDLDLRQGGLSFQRGFGFLKEKVPLLTGLGAAVLISFAFATWAEMRALSRDEETLTKALSALSKEVLGQPAETAEEAQTLLERAKGLEETDPMPHMDAYDTIVELSTAIPMSITHDIEDFDMQRGHLKLSGVVGSTQDAQQIATALKEVKCFEDVKISKITQVVNSDRQKYVLELDVRCPEDAPKKKKKKADGTGDSPETEESSQ
ncbi:MAG TPA: pilus assembly protein PilM [Polyangiaceae bacterium]|nr:pilus assembly protein PilM [Polyangiaceae bacterium]